MRVAAERSFSKMPRKMTASEVKSVLKVVRDQDS
jgi:hypothetical protein